MPFTPNSFKHASIDFCGKAREFFTQSIRSSDLITYSVLPIAPANQRRAGIVPEIFVESENQHAALVLHLDKQPLAGGKGEDFQAACSSEGVPGILLTDMRPPAVIVEQDNAAIDQARPKIFARLNLRRYAIHVDRKVADCFRFDGRKRIRHAAAHDTRVGESSEIASNQLVAIEIHAVMVGQPQCALFLGQLPHRNAFIGIQQVEPAL